MFACDAEEKSSPRIGDWALRGGVALLFFAFGAEKFDSSPGSTWVRLFQQIGLGQGLRWLTGAVEVAGAALVLLPRTASFALLLLALTMAAAACILDFLLRRPGDSILSTALFLALLAFWWARRN